MAFEVKYDKDGYIIKDNLVMEAAKKAKDPSTLIADAPEPFSEIEAEQPVLQEAIEQEAEEMAEEAQEETVEEVQAVEEEKVKTIQQKAAQESWKALRSKAEAAERERDELRRQLQEAKDQKTEAEDIGLGDEDFAEGKHLKKLQNETKRTRQELENMKRQVAYAQDEARVRARFPDIDQVVSEHNLAMLNEKYPELTQSIQSNSDFYTKAVSAYTMIKNMGIYQEDNRMAEKKRIVANTSKPKPVASIAPKKGSSALQQANAFQEELTEEYKAQLYKEMNSARQNY